MPAQKFQIVIELDLATEGFDVKVVNMSSRKGFIDIQKLKEHLKDVLMFLHEEGIDSLTSEIEKDQVH